MNNWCVMCSEQSTYVDEVTGNRFCQLHAGPLAWDPCAVNEYTIAVRLAGHLDVPVESLRVRRAA